MDVATLFSGHVACPTLFAIILTAATATAEICKFTFHVEQDFQVIKEVLLSYLLQTQRNRNIFFVKSMSG